MKKKLKIREKKVVPTNVLLKLYKKNTFFSVSDYLILIYLFVKILEKYVVVILTNMQMTDL